PTVNSMLLASTDPARLRDWYAAGLDPEDNTDIDGYLILKFGGFYLMIDRRADVGDKNPEPRRMILNFHASHARAVVARLSGLGTAWLAELEDRDGSLFATAIDPDGNYVQVIELSAAHRAAMADQR